MQTKRIKVARIRIGAVHHGFEIDTQRIKDLADSIDRRGQLHAITVRESPRTKNYFELIAGECRLRAMKRLGRPTITANVIKCDDLDAKQISLEENLKRHHLNAAQKRECIALWVEVEESRHGKLKGRPKKSAKKSSTKVESANRGSHFSPKAVTKKAADKFKTSTRSVQLAIKAHKNLTKASKRAHDKKRITTKQADKLARLTPEKQKVELENMLGENFSETRKRFAETEKQEKVDAARKRGPTEARKLLLKCERHASETLMPNLDTLLQIVKADWFDKAALKRGAYPALIEVRDAIDTMADLLGHG